MSNRMGIGLIILLATLSTVASMGNGFAYDDIPVILENDSLHSLRNPLSWLGESYWPLARGGANYRPWTVLAFNLQWLIGGGAPWVFHLVNCILAVVIAVGVYILARRWLSPMAALIAGAVFAVHPVHVEATGNVVGQAELWMTMAVVAALIIWTRPASSGPHAAGARVAVLLCFLIAATAKEQGFLLPGFLLLAAWLSGRRNDSSHDIGELRKVLPSLGVAGVALVFLRSLVVDGSGAGPVVHGIRGLDLLERIPVVLSIIPEVIRLLIWPQHLAAEYGVPALGGSTGWTPSAFLGLLSVMALVLIGILSWRRAPLIGIGILWVALAWFPVSNLLVPTGILLAERTLYLPTVGLALALGATIDAMAVVWPRRIFVLCCAVAVVLGTSRSNSRQAVWRDNATLFRQTVRDQPGAYRSHALLATVHRAEGHPEQAIEAYRRANALYGGDVELLEDYARALRQLDRCHEAIPLFDRALQLDADRPVASVTRLECLIVIGSWDRAEALAGALPAGEERQRAMARISAGRGDTRHRW
ncbi:MAG: tetratricopeptide repeat protein [Gemmatimonadales bacterium]|nr:tetratricopeptide repeat protein [Gemmatimonadales bacterium]